MWKNGPDHSAHKPGPGNYGSRTFVGQGKAASFGGKYKPEKNSNPGPGEYENDGAAVKKSSAVAKVGGAKRPDIWKKGADDTRLKPGPGNYSSSSFAGKGKSY